MQAHYRYYWDLSTDSADTVNPWHIHSHTFEGRLFQRLGRALEVRLTGRYYPQSAATFWCDTSLVANCDTTARYYASDPKLGPVSTKYLEGKVYWDATEWRGTPFFGWFAGGTFELSYGRLWQNTLFGNAHVAQTGYTFPF